MSQQRYTKRPNEFWRRYSPQIIAAAATFVLVLVAASVLGFKNPFRRASPSGQQKAGFFSGGSEYRESDRFTTAQIDWYVKHDGDYIRRRYGLRNDAEVRQMAIRLLEGNATYRDFLEQITRGDWDSRVPE